MLYIDGISLNKIKDELESTLKGKGINKITQTSSLAISMNFGKQRLIFSCFPSLSLCYLSNQKEDNLLDESTTFSLNLKKYLGGSSLISINQIGFDRILIFKFSKLNELGEVKTFNLYFEMMGKHSNLVLTDSNNKVIDSIKRFSLEENSARVLFPGIDYSNPTIDLKIDPSTISKENFNIEKENNTLTKNVEGMGKILVKSLISFENLQEILQDKISPKFYLDENKNIILATVLNIKPANYSSVLEFSTCEEWINTYIETQQLSNTFKLLKDKLKNSIKREIKKNEKTIKAIEKDIIERTDFDRYRELGDILAASLYSLKKGLKEIELYDFYNDKMCIIPLDPLCSPQVNLEKIYKKYNKQKKGLIYSEKRLIEAKDNLKYFIGLNTFIENSESRENLKLIEEELISQGYLKLSVKQKRKDKKKKDKNKIISFGETEILGVPILYGRNNIENDTLTTKASHREDLWFHCKDIPGTHVVVNNSIQLTDEQIYGIAVFCAQMSKLPSGSKVTVDYTKIKYLNKPKGARPGFVTYKIFNTIIVTI